MKQKKIPMRRCIGCYESKPKKELLRIVRNSEGIIQMDFSGKMNGRGAYLCDDAGCFEKMVKGNKLSREFETEIKMETYEALRVQFEKRTEADSSKSGGGAIG
mgnify:CR=1 FL=1